MRDIEGEKMWDGYLLNEQDKGRYPNRDKTIPYSDGGGDHEEANIDKPPRSSRQLFDYLRDLLNTIT